MPLFELLISKREDKKGDIVAVKRTPCVWGSKEKENYLIVSVQLDRNYEKFLLPYNKGKFNLGFEALLRENLSAGHLSAIRFEELLTDREK